MLIFPGTFSNNFFSVGEHRVWFTKGRKSEIITGAKFSDWRSENRIFLESEFLFFMFAMNAIKRAHVTFQKDNVLVRHRRRVVTTKSNFLKVLHSEAFVDYIEKNPVCNSMIIFWNGWEQSRDVHKYSLILPQSSFILCEFSAFQNINVCGSLHATR